MTASDEPAGAAASEEVLCRCVLRGRKNLGLVRNLNLAIPPSALAISTLHSAGAAVDCSVKAVARVWEVSLEWKKAAKVVKVGSELALRTLAVDCPLLDVLGHPVLELQIDNCVADATGQAREPCTFFDTEAAQTRVASLTGLCPDVNEGLEFDAAKAFPSASIQGRPVRLTLKRPGKNLSLVIVDALERERPAAIKRLGESL